MQGKIVSTTLLLSMNMLTSPVQAEPQMPSMAFLEFLAELDQEDGEWLDKTSTQELRTDDSQQNQDVKKDKNDE